jgi:hypothetical protein
MLTVVVLLIVAIVALEGIVAQKNGVDVVVGTEVLWGVDV